MIIDGATIPSDEQIRADICVVGAGPAGLTVARELGWRHRIVVLESGDEHPAEPAEDTATSVGIPYPVADSRARAVGGTSTMWRVQTYDGGGFVRLRELDDIDFQSREWIPFSGWPITKSDLDDGYRRARRLFGLPPREEAIPDTAPAVDAAGAIASRGTLAPRLFHFAPRTVFTEDVPRSLAEMPGASLVKNATVVDIRCDDAPNEVSALHVAVTPGHSFTVRARLYVLAAGGIDNARLLLMSRSRHSQGLGNATGLVGRFFMEHPHLTSGLFWPSDPRWLNDPRSFAIHPSADHPAQWKYGHREDVQRAERLTGCVFAFSSQPLNAQVMALRDGAKGRRALRAAIDIRDACKQGHLPHGRSQAVKDAVVGMPYAVKHIARSATVAVGRRTGAGRYTSPRLFQISAMAEQVPNPDSRVRLAARRDRFGLPEAELDWRLTDDDLDSMRRSQLLLAAALDAGSFGRVETLLDGHDLPPGLNGGPHHMGTTRMHRDPKKGVVDADSKLHEAHNLYVAGSSVFPTGGYANPTLTIVALAFRLADHLGARLR